MGNMLCILTYCLIGYALPKALNAMARERSRDTPRGGSGAAGGIPRWMTSS